MSFNAEKVKAECVEWIRHWFDENGKDCNAVIGISGGKDSTVVAGLCVEALGKDRVVGVLMPNGAQSDIEDAYAVCDYLDIERYVIDIKRAISSLRFQIVHNKNPFQFPEQAEINLPPRIRMATLYFISQSLGGRVACTDNLSESYIGYSTRWGDSVGDFSPLANLTSEEVVAIGDALGLPYELTHKVPSDGLCGKTDEDNFGFTYEVLNKYIRTREIDDEEVKNRIDELHRKNSFKLQPIPKFEYKGWD